MRVYITKANSMRILRKLDYSKLNLDGTIYSCPIFFLNKREEQALLAYKEFVKNPERFVDEIYQRVEIVDNYKYVFEGEAPCYHRREDCERLHSEFRNYEIPQEIRNRGIEWVNKYREWFKENLYLLESREDVLEMRIYAAFGIHVKAKEIIKENSGVKTIINFELNQLEEKLNTLIKEAGKYYYKSSKHTRILKQYSKFAFLGAYADSLYNNNTGYSDEVVKELLLEYEEQYKKPIIEMLYNYYRVKFNPELEMEGALLDQLGFRPCIHCFS